MPRKTTLTPSPEIAAMAQIENVLSSIGEEELVRVLDWLHARFGPVRRKAHEALDLLNLTNFAGNCPGAEDLAGAAGEGEP